ncbi:CPBP family glutamic-type intramembrane protease [Bacillus sp. FSL H8-0547]
MKKLEMKLALFIGVICFGAGFLLLPYQLETLNSALPQSEFEKMTADMQVGIMSLAFSAQLFLMSFLLAWAGFHLARKTGFSFDILQSFFEKGQNKSFAGKPFVLAVIFGGITGFLIVASDRFYFENRILQLNEFSPEFSWLGLAAGVVGGGVFEETLLRLFFVSFLVWGFRKIFRTSGKTVYWAAILIAALGFAALHLPFTFVVFGELTGLIVFRSFLLNGIGGIFFGYLYWKNGFEYAIISHMFAHISMQLLFIPLFY